MTSLSLRQRIIATFVGCSLLIALLFGLASFLFAYHIEDRFFVALLNSEADYVQQQLAAGSEVTPRMPFIRYYPELAALPADIVSTLHNSPRRTEFPGSDDQHFHLTALPQGYLLADVSEQLIVRHIRPLMLQFLLTLLGIVLLFTALLAWLLAKRLLKPLQQLTTLIDQAPQQSLPKHFASSFPPDETGRFADALEQALCRVEAFISRERQFSRDISHELRTPITISQGALTLLEHTALNPQQSALVNRLHQAQQQMEQGMALLLELAREQSSSHSEQSQLLPVVETSILQQHSRLNGKTVSVEVDVAAKVQVPVAETALLILLNNLLGNAFNYTQSGTVRIHYQHNELSICDTGSGISEPLQDHVFVAGVKGENSQGMGMGLSIVQRLCEKWQIQCELQSSDAGTCVRLRFL